MNAVLKLKFIYSTVVRAKYLQTVSSIFDFITFIIFCVWSTADIMIFTNYNFPN